jgi:NAD(P)-dependent dehydrogenase (short-subunit alcohol dehydrogenase family)
MGRDARTALIVGASRGLGLGLAEELVRRGWRVIGTARSADPGGKLQRAAEGSSGKLSVESVDVNDAAGVDSFCKRMSGQRLDLLFLNAGVTGPDHQSVDTVTEAELGALLMTNAVAPLHIARRLLQNVVDGGTIAFMSSRMGSVTDNLTGRMDLYRASKAALNMLTRSFVATTVGERSVSVLTLHPGWVRTDMGGAEAPLGIPESVTGLADVLEGPRKSRHQFLDYQGQELPW